MSKAPNTEPMQRTGDNRLEGWKRIARHLDRDVRTVRRWEKNEGLPVHRLMHEKLPRVYAFRNELDSWRGHRAETAARPAGKQKQSKTNTGRLPAWLGPSALLVVVLFAFTWWLLPKQEALLKEWDWVLITRFENRTEDPQLHEAVEYAIARELSNSRFVKVVPPERANDVLQLMKLPGDTDITPEVGREISLRDGAIRILISGRIEQLGESYSMSVNLVDPADGVSYSSLNVEAGNRNEILPALGRLARELRENLGEDIISIRQSEQELSRVTTPSLQALRLYSEAELMMKSIDRMKATPLLEEAVRLDPDFASAHHLLWYLLKHETERDKAVSHLQRAVDLAPSSSERERLFVLSTYYRDYLQDEAKTIETLELLIRQYPDHYWGVSNLTSYLETRGRYAQAYPYRIQRADLRPNSGWSQLETAQAALISGDRETAEVYFGKARLLVEKEPWLKPAITLLPVYDRWLSADYAGVGRMLDEMITDTGTGALIQNGGLYRAVSSTFLAIGRMETFRELSQLTARRGWMDALPELDYPASPSLNTYLDNAGVSYWTATLMAIGGRLDRSREMLNDPRSVAQVPPPYMINEWRNLAAAHLAFAEAADDLAMQLIVEALPGLRITDRLAFLLGSHLLAQAQERKGLPGQAIETLESLAVERDWSIFEPGALSMWFRTQQYLIRLYDRNDQTVQADRLASDLLNLLAAADKDHPERLALQERVAGLD